MHAAVTRRAGPLFGAFLVVVGFLAAFSPVIPPVEALDPTPAPSVSGDPSAGTSPVPGVADPAADPTPAPDPSAAPSEDPAGPTAAPSDPAPVPSSDPAPVPTVDPTAAPSDAPSAAPTQAPGPTGPGLHVTHYWVDVENDLGNKVTEGALDAPVADMDRFVVYRVRFQVLNDGPEAVSVTPRLDFAASGSDTFTAVAAVDPNGVDPFYAASDKGRTWEVRTATLDAGKLRLDAAGDAKATPVDGIASAGVNPLPALDLPARSFTEIQFSIRATAEAAWNAGYLVRLALGAGVADRVDASVTMRSQPVVTPPPGASTGKAVNEGVLHPLKKPTSSMLTVTTSSATAMSGYLAPQAASFTSPHVNLATTLTSDACASCHESHMAQGEMLRAQPQISSLCFSCHDGTGATSNVQAEFTSPQLPANNASTSSYYSHPALQPEPLSDVLAGQLNRRAQCTDCHQPHLADGTRPVATSNGWSASGAITGASGVSVANGAAGSQPVYTPITHSLLEYQLCFKCHSGYTQLPAQTPGHPSWWSLDKGVELNPANVSYHPVEAQGKNQSAWMQESLNGWATGKLWRFKTTDVVRCANCHGPNGVGTDGQNPDINIDNHASVNRGILLRNYQDRTLNAKDVAYNSNEFALCYLCHGERPMVDTSGSFPAVPDTNFQFHGRHVAGISGNGNGGLDIDQPGAGQGNAVCAECHFRSHSTAYPVNGQASYPALVNFSPNVLGLDASGNPSASVPPVFVQAVGNYGSCTLVCHGKVHDHLRY